MRDLEFADETSKARALITVCELAVDSRSFDIENEALVYGLSMILGDARRTLDAVADAAEDRARKARNEQSEA